MVSTTASLAIIAGLVPAARAAAPDQPSVPPTDNRKLIDLADVAVVVHVEDGSHSVPGDRAAPVDTLVPVTITGGLKGATAGQKITVREPGGFMPNGDFLHSSLSPDLYSGDDAVLFLTKEPDGTYRTVYGSTGVFKRLVPGGPNGEKKDNPLFHADPTALAVSVNCNGGVAGFSGYVLENGAYGHFVQSGPALAFGVNSGAQALQAGFDSAIFGWNQTGGTLTIVDTGLTTADATNHGDGLNTVGYGTANDPSAWAETYWLQRPGGTAAESDVIVNAAKQGQFSTGNNLPASNQVDSIGMFMHEVGHSVGSITSPTRTKSCGPARRRARCGEISAGATPPASGTCTRPTRRATTSYRTTAPCTGSGVTARITTSTPPTTAARM
ncbi:MAG TPA: hypothetical protein VFA94_14700 [Acidimicrobiales bacterium]|nr:hypothetical protein [Acidimicrobiales bacterium]